MVTGISVTFISSEGAQDWTMATLGSRSFFFFSSSSGKSLGGALEIPGKLAVGSHGNATQAEDNGV